MDEVGIVMDLEEKQTIFLMSLALNFKHQTTAASYFDICTFLLYNFFVLSQFSNTVIYFLKFLNRIFFENPKYFYLEENFRALP